jgi:hypothetical protein
MVIYYLRKTQKNTLGKTKKAAPPVIKAENCWLSFTL